MGDWLYVSHPDAGSTRLPNQPGVRESYEARGWVVGDDPEADGAPPFVPPKAVEANEEDGWVTLYHRDTHAEHRFPSHPDAVQGAYDSGWRVTKPKTEDDAAPVPDDPAPAKRSTRKPKNTDAATVAEPEPAPDADGDTTASHEPATDETKE